MIFGVSDMGSGLVGHRGGQRAIVARWGEGGKTEGRASRLIDGGWPRHPSRPRPSCPDPAIWTGPDHPGRRNCPEPNGQQSIRRMS